jgi:cyanophycinase-like exopeptidase
MGEKVKGNLLIIGGAEDKLGQCKVLRNFVDISGEKEAQLVVITTATENPDKVGGEYLRIFEKIGTENIEILNINKREDANNQKSAEIIRNSTGIFFTGGDQLRITSILGGTKVYEALYDAYKRGVAIAGTSAGASVMSSTMIVEGDSNDPARKCTLKRYYKSTNGFAAFANCQNYLTLFTTWHNFLRPHKSLGYRVPVDIPEVTNLPNMPARWLELLDMAQDYILEHQVA